MNSSRGIFSARIVRAFKRDFFFSFLSFLSTVPCLHNTSDLWPFGMQDVFSILASVQQFPDVANLVSFYLFHKNSDIFIIPPPLRVQLLFLTQCRYACVRLALQERIRSFTFLLQQSACEPSCKHWDTFMWTTVSWNDVTRFHDQHP
jgi:hypothetical protein